MNNKQPEVIICEDCGNGYFEFNGVNGCVYICESCGLEVGDSDIDEKVGCPECFKFVCEPCQAG